MPRNCWTRCNKTFPCSFPAREKTREIESRETSKRLEKQAILALLRKMIYKFKFSATGLTAAATASVSGITAGLFGIGGPPLAPYLLSVARSNEEYIGMMQTMFALSSSVGMLLRIVRGIYTVELLPATVLGTIGILLGKRVGLKMLKKISKENMMKLVYSMIAVSGILTIAANT